MNMCVCVCASHSHVCMYVCMHVVVCAYGMHTHAIIILLCAFRLLLSCFLELPRSGASDGRAPVQAGGCREREEAKEKGVHLLEHSTCICTAQHMKMYWNQNKKLAL